MDFESILKPLFGVYYNINLFYLLVTFVYIIILVISFSYLNTSPLLIMTSTLGLLLIFMYYLYRKSNVEKAQSAFKQLSESSGIAEFAIQSGSFILSFLILSAAVYFSTRLFGGGNNATLYIVNFIIFIVFLAMVYRTISREVSKSSTKSAMVVKLITQVILYIPCVLVDFIEFIYKQYNITPPIHVTLIFIELFLILGYYGSGYIIKQLGKTGAAKTLLEGPVYLNERRVLGSFSELIPETKKYNFAISLWFYINPQQSAKETVNILTIAGKPAVTYSTRSNSVTVTAMTESGNKQVALIPNIKLQKWNHLVVNYVDGTMDVILDGKLVGTQNSVLIYSLSDTIVCGENASDVDGGVKRVDFYSHSLTSPEIELIYGKGTDI